MCGFLIQVAPDPASVPRAVLERLPESLAHRGRDDFQTLTGPLCRIWSWRLALVDRSASRQPMRSRNNKVTLLFNGEVYNYRSLRSELAALGSLFRTEGDTEVVLEAYLRWGLSCFQRFEGMFSICLVDERRQKVLLARDPLGIKPLYFCNGPEALWAASEPKALFSAGAASPALNPDALRAYLLFQTVPGADTLFRSVQKVPPGSIYEFDLRSRKLLGVHPTMRAASAPSAGIGHPVPRTVEEARALAREVLTESARLTFDTDLPLAFHLSGGMDSNLLVSLFRRLHPEREALCLSSLIEGEQDPEWPHIREAAAAHRFRLERVTVDAESFFSLLDEATFGLDEPAGDPGVVPQFLVNRLCSQHAKIVMTGHGLDEMFFGYIRNLAGSILEEGGEEAIRPGSPRFGELPPDTRAFFGGWEGFLRSMAEPREMPATLRYFRKLCRLDPFAAGASALSPEMRRLALQTHDDIAGQAPSMGEFMLAAETRIQLPALLQMEDRASMRYTVEARVPFCNPSVLALAQAIPCAWKLRGGAPKGLLRDAFRDILPAPVLARREKVGRPVPLSRWLGEPAGRPFREQLEGSRELFRELASCDLVEMATREAGPHDRLLWGLLSLSRWMELYQVSV